MEGQAPPSCRGYVQIFKGFHRLLQDREAAEIEAAFGVRLVCPVDEIMASMPPVHALAGFPCSTSWTWFCAGSSTTSAAGFPTHPRCSPTSPAAISRRAVRNRLRYLMELEGRRAVDRCSPHALRRACVTRCYERGVDLVAIRHLLGHWTVGSTMGYARPSATFIEDAWRRAVTTTLGELTGEDHTP